MTLTKEVPGQDFKDLDLLAKLLAPRPPRDAPMQPVIEVLDSQDAAQHDETDELVERIEGLKLEQTQELTQEQREILEGLLPTTLFRALLSYDVAAAENDWQLPQTVPEPLPQLQTSAQRRYGFLDMHSGYFSHVAHTENEVNELGLDGETCPPKERRRRRLKHEDEKWDEEHYM